MLKLDCTGSGCVIRCTDCGHWSAFRFTKTEAWEAGRGHERLVHPGSRQAANVLTNRRARSAS